MAPPLATDELDIDGRSLPVDLHVHPRARRLTLRVDRTSGRLRITLPPGVAAADGLRFALRHRIWLRGQLAALPPQTPFAEGATIPFQGEAHRIRRIDSLRGLVARAEGEILVPGAPEHLARRVADYLKAEARRELTTLSRSLAGQLDPAKARPLGRIRLRDTSSRWGSCTQRGDLSYSWRIILAPARVLEYLAAHEVAHLQEMNHSPRFWAVVDQLTPHRRFGRDWLKREGASLLRYG